MFSYTFQENNERYQIYVAEKYVLVLSLIMFYHKRMTVVYKVIGSIIYSCIYDFICIDYLVIIQHKLCAYDKQILKRSSVIFLGWVLLKE